MTDSNKKIGRRITEAREYAKMSKKDLAEKAHVSPSTITRYEKGEFGRVKIALIEAFAKSTGVNPSWIDGNSDKMFLTDADRFERTAEIFNTAHANLPTLREKELITNYRKLNDTNKGKVDTYISGLLSIQSEEEFVQRVEEANAREKEGS